MIKKYLNRLFIDGLSRGRLTDSKGRTVDFKNTIVIMTSNIGSQYLIDGIQEDGTVADSVKQQVENEMTRYFRPSSADREELRSKQELTI